VFRQLSLYEATWAENIVQAYDESNWKWEWTSHTVSHNALVIDGVSQRPAGDKDLMWPCDSGNQRAGHFGA
jgi:hypothetical protein